MSENNLDLPRSHELSFVQDNNDTRVCTLYPDGRFELDHSPVECVLLLWRHGDPSGMIRPMLRHALMWAKAQQRQSDRSWMKGFACACQVAASIGDYTQAASIWKEGGFGLEDLAKYDIDSGDAELIQEHF